MVASTLAASRLSRAEVAAGDLVLRISSSSRKGQIVRLRSEKCTIGSGPRCTLRLRDRNVAPVHCLILRGPAATVVRRWAPDTRLNHQAFVDAPLSPGDRLGVGPIEFEVVSLGVVPADAARTETAAESHAAAPRPETAQEQLRLEQEQLRLEQEQDRLEQLAESLRQRETSLAAELQRANDLRAAIELEREAFNQQRLQWQSEQAERQAEQAERQAGLDAQQTRLSTEAAALANRQQALASQQREWESQQTQADHRAKDQIDPLIARLAELEAERDDLELQRRQWQAEQAELQSQVDQLQNQIASQTVQVEHGLNSLTERQEQLASQAAKIEEDRNALAEQRRQWESDRAEAANQAEAQAKHLDQQLAKIQSEQQSLQDLREQWRAEQLDAKRQLAQQREELEAHRADLDAERGKFEERCRLWEMQRAESPTPEPTAEIELTPEPQEELEFETPKEGSPVDLNEVFRRVGAKVEATESEEPAKPQIERPSADATRRAAVSPTPNASETEEESIDSYMSRLMERVRPEASPVAAAYVPPSPKPAVPEQPASPPTAETPAAELSQQIKYREPIELPPRTAAPEKRIDLSALRELANLAAKSAINRHSRQLLISTMYSKLAVMLTALAAGAVLLLMWKRFGAWHMTFYSALAALLVALYWGVEYAILSGRLVISKTGHIDVDRKGSSAANHGPAKKNSPLQSPANGGNPFAENAAASDEANPDAS